MAPWASRRPSRCADQGINTETGPGLYRGPLLFFFVLRVVQRLKTWSTFIGAPKLW